MKCMSCVGSLRWRPRQGLHDPQLNAAKIGAVVLCDVFGVQLGEDHDLLLNIVDFVLCIFEVDDLDGNGSTGSLVVTFVHLAKGALLVNMPESARCSTSTDLTC